MTTPAFKLAGSDGFSKQWLAILATNDFAICRVQPFKSLAQLLESYPALKVATVDTPIDLPDERNKRRKCVEEAKERLGDRRASVFYAPHRFLVNAPDYSSANTQSKQVSGYGLSTQRMAFSVTSGMPTP